MRVHARLLVPVPAAVRADQDPFFYFFLHSRQNEPRLLPDIGSRSWLHLKQNPPNVHGSRGDLAVLSDAAIRQICTEPSITKVRANSIYDIQFDTPDAWPSALDIALQQLGQWMDAEHETLGRVLAQAGRRGASGILDMLDELHLETDPTPATMRELLEDAREVLTVLKIVGDIPYRCRLETAWGLPGPEPFEVHVRWCAARLADIIATLDWALAA